MPRDYLDRDLISDADLLTDLGALKQESRDRTLLQVRSELIDKGELKIRIPVAVIDANPYQPRQDFGDVEGMALSLREQGQDYPIIVRKVGERFQVADGETRLRAFRINDERHPDGERWTSIEAVIRDLTDQEMALIAFRTAYQRKALLPIEEGRGFDRMEREFTLTHRQLSDLVGKPKDYVIGRIRLINLPADLQGLLERDVEPLAPAHAINLAIVKDAGIRSALSEVVLTQGLTVLELRRRIDLIETIQADVHDDARRRALIEKAIMGDLDEDKLAKATTTETTSTTRSPKPWDRVKTVWKAIPKDRQQEFEQRLAALVAEFSKE